MHNRVNVLFLVHSFSMGGIQKVNIRMINDIDKTKFNVHVLYVKEGMLMDDLTDKINISKLGSILKLKSLVNIKYVYKIMNYIRANNIDIIHTIDSVLYSSGAIAANLTKIKHVRTQPNFIRRHEKLNAKTLKYLPFEKWTDKFITYNQASANDLALAGVNQGKIYTIYGFNKHEEFLKYKTVSSLKKEFNIPNDNKVILAMHRMVPKKGYETFIDMIPYIIKEYKNVTFLLVGDGPLREDFEKRVKRLGITNYVRFTGFQKNIANIAKQIDFGVYPLADTAAMGAVLRSGKVLITKKNSSMDEYIIDGVTGHLVSEDAPEVYAKYVLNLLKKPELVKEMEERQIQYVIEKFDGDKNMKKLEEVFTSLCRESNALVGKEQYGK